MPQRRLARDCNPASLVRLVNKPHCPVGAQRKLRSFLLWGDGGNIVCDQQCPPGSLHSECRWDGAFGLGHQRRSHPPHPPRGRPPRLPLPQLPKPLSFQPAQVLSASSVSATAAHAAPRPLRRRHHSLPAALGLPEGRKPAASAEWSLGSATLVVSLLLGLRQCCHWAFRTKSEPSSAPAVGPRLTLHPSSLFSVFSLLLYVTDSNLGDRSLPHGLVQRGAA